MKYNRRVFKLVNLELRLIKKDLLISKFPTGDFKEILLFPLAIWVKTVKILLLPKFPGGRIVNNTRLSVNNFIFLCLLQQTGSLVGVNLFNA